MDPISLMALARHGDAVATVRAFAERSGALRVVLLTDAGNGDTLMVDCTDTGEVEIIEGDDAALIPAGAIVPAPPRPLPSLRPAPATAISIDVETGEIAAPIGTIAHLADATLALARAFGGHSVATAEFATRDPDVPITFAARDGEPVVLAAGDQQYEL